MSVAGALRDWQSAVGERHVLSTPEVVAAASRATYPIGHGVPAVVRPASTEQVQDCVRIAQRHCVPLYPISGGKNWGYGSRVPPVEGAVVLDLGRMRRITGYDEELACVTIEPGVTQQMLYDYLQARGGRLWMDGTGSSPRASVLGNIMERGFGSTPYGDHVGMSCCYEVVLPDGELLHTGYAAYPKARVAQVDRWAPGPQLDGLFSQSNLGVVTKVSLALMPAPECSQLIMLDLAGAEQLVAAVDVMRRLHLEGTVRSAPWFGNHYRLLATVMRYPWHRQPVPPLSPEVADELAREHGIARYSGFAALYGTRSQVSASRRRVLEKFREGGIPVEIVDRDTLAKAPDGARRSIQLSMYTWHTGGILNAVRRAYWRKPQPVPADMDPDRDGIGFIFINASLPFRGADVAAAATIGERIVLEHGFEPKFNCYAVRPRAFVGLLTFAWDRDVPGDDEAALAAHDAAARAWADRGWYALRLGVHSMKLLDLAEPTHRSFVTAVKNAVDPAGVIAPGRYVR